MMRVYRVLALSLLLLSGCGIVAHSSGSTPVPSTPANFVHSSSGQVSGSQVFQALPANPIQVIVIKNHHQKTIVNEQLLQSLVAEFNRAARGKQGYAHCMVYTNDVYEIRFVYSDGDVRTFTNRGGSCQPMVDVASGFKFSAGDILNDHNLQ